MRKIYPLSKFAIFVLYGILSLAATTLAQQLPTETCESNPVLSSKYVTMGYVRLFGNNPTNLDTIQWKSYDYINVIAYPNGGNSPWNSIRRPGDPKALDQIGKLIKARDDSKSDTKILLSIRNYDPMTWPVPEDDDDDEVYIKMVDETFETLTFNKLDGVDIEYPGMRGLYCNQPASGKSIWVEGEGGKEKKDEDFIKFLNDLREKIGDKTLMVTVGSDIVTGLIANQNQIDFLNIETHHFSLYENLRNPVQGNPDFVRSYSNSPINAFENAYNAWAGFNSTKIFMGVDFGNTLQVVSNPNIATTPSVEFNTLDTINNEDFINDPVLKGVAKINGLCSLNVEMNRMLRLYSFPWKDLSKSVLDKTDYCTATGWTRKFDDNEGGSSIPSKTPWLYRVVSNPLNPPDNPDTPDIYQFISYEDFTSLSIKLKPFMGKIGGISISDVSNDDGSLLNFISSKGAKSPDPEESPNPDSGNGDPSSNSTDPVKADGNDNNLDPDPKKTPTGKIAGGVIGGLLCLIILGACAFIGYRYRKKPKSESFRSLLMSIPSSFKNHSTASRNTEMTYDPSPNMLAPPTTVIPVASGYVTAMFDFTGKEENDLSFKKGDKIEVLERGDGPNDWWVGRVNGAVGEFPGNYVKET